MRIRTTTAPASVWGSLALCSSLLACALSDEWTPEHYEEISGVCLSPVGAGAQALEPNAPLSLSVSFGPMSYSSGCSRKADSGCEIAIQGQTLVLDAFLTVEEKTREKGQRNTVTCHLDQRSYHTDCAIDPLPAGTYEVVASPDSGGAHLLTVTLPSTSPTPLCTQGQVEDDSGESGAAD